MSDNPKIPTQRGSAKNITAKNAKASATFQPEYVNGSLELSGPKNSRPGKLSQYTRDLLVYTAALEKEIIGLRDKQSSLDAKIIELNDAITVLEGQITANNEQHERKLTEAKTATRAANTAMDSARTRANLAEANEDVRQSIHDLFGGAPVGSLSNSGTGSMDGVPARAAYFTCGGLHFAHSVSSKQSSVTVKSASDNPVKLREYIITRFSGNDLLMPDKTHLLFLREAATVEGFKQNKKRLNDREMHQLYRMDQVNRVFGCGHNAIRHAEMREELLLKFAPAIVTMVFERLEGYGSTDSHSIELMRAVMIFVGTNEITADTWAKKEAKNAKELDQAKQKLRSEGYDPELARALGTSALFGTVDHEALDLRPENLRPKSRLTSDALRHIRGQDSLLFHGTPGLYGGLRPIISEYNRGSKIESDPYGENFGDFPKGVNFTDFPNLPKGEAHDLGVDGLFTSDDRPAVKDIKPEHSGECRNNGATEGCTHPDHQSEG